MKIFLTFIVIALYTGGIFMAGMMVVQLYALYVLIFTGGVFMAGLWFGQRWERSWDSRHKEDSEISGQPLSETGSSRAIEAAVTIKSQR